MDPWKLKSEVSQKVIGALQAIVSDHERGLISRAQAATGVRGIYDATSGLVDTETFDILSEVAQRYKGVHGVEVQFKRVGKHLEGYVRVCGRGRVVRITQAIPHYTAAYTDENADTEAARQAARLFNDIGK